MPDIADDNWSERDDQNAEVAPYGWPPGVPAQIELIGRMMMGAIKRSWRRLNPFYPTTGTADAYVVTPSSNPPAINIYEIIRVRIDRANTTTAPTLKYGGANPRTIKRITPAGKVAVAVGDLVAGKDHAFWYDGTDFILMDPATISGTLVTGALLAANNLADVLNASTSLSNLGGAPLNSPTFTGTVTIPSGASIAGYAPLASPTFTGTVTIPSGASIAGYALLASPAFTGNPTAPTQAAGNNSTRLATTAYADGAVATSAATKADNSAVGSFIDGGLLSNNGANPNTHIDFAAMSVRSGSSFVSSGSSLTKRINATWAAGTGNGGLDTGAVAANSTYFPYALRKDADGTLDVVLSTSATIGGVTTTLLTGYTIIKQIGVVLTDGSSNIRQFVMYPRDEYSFVTPVKDAVNIAVSTTSALLALTVPNAVKAKAKLRFEFTSSSTTNAALLSDPAQGTLTSGIGNDGGNVGTIQVASGFAVSGQEIWTNTSRQIRYVSSASGNLWVWTDGFYLPCGRIA